MFRPAVLVTAALLIGTSACAPQIGRHGFQPVDVTPGEIETGVDTKSTVLARLGSPSATSTFEDNIWYYISQTTERYTWNPSGVAARSVTAISFNEGDDTVAEVRQLGLEDGQQVAMNGRETPTRGRELSAIEQILGTVGRGQLPRTEDDVPGQRRPD
ncbi:MULTISPECIES: outer membrane protein assembly factor BamE [Brevundimonas]|uniref:outer membrane protein assembly factor BamE n=1 Tax=Brevundimonas TaxID=41275 RepID=UPI000F0317C3|nr:outer membrane protein assembly factor BamE [Brevundimonas lutea]